MCAHLGGAGLYPGGDREDAVSHERAVRRTHPGDTAVLISYQATQPFRVAS
jgi:hypothetical protein